MDLQKYQSKSLTPVDEYQCTLSDELQKLAFKDFGETEELRQNGIREMREWILNNERIEKCRLDSIYLLKFLRFRKYDLPKAKEAYERFLVFREGVYGGDWFSNLDYNKPNIPSLVDQGLLVVLPNRDKYGRLTILARLAVTDPSIPTIGLEGLTLGTMVLDILLDDEENQIRGFNYIFDSSKIQLRHYFMFSFKFWFKLGKSVEKTLAARHKNFLAVNVHPTLRFVGKLVLKHMPEKLRKRVRFLANFDEFPSDIVPKDDFPVECGGQASLKELIAPLKKVLESKSDFYLNVTNKMKVNRSCYPGNVLKCSISTLNTPFDVLCAKQKLVEKPIFLEFD